MCLPCVWGPMGDHRNNSNKDIGTTTVIGHDYCICIYVRHVVCIYVRYVYIMIPKYIW